MTVLLYHVKSCTAHEKLFSDTLIVTTKVIPGTTQTLVKKVAIQYLALPQDVV